jgi:hypothetical protein
MVISIKQRNRRHDHPRGAVAALHRTLIKKCPLHGVELFVVRKAFNAGDLFFGNGPNPGDAGSLRSSVDQDSARSALTFSASVFRPSQIEVFPQYREKAGLRICVDRVGTSVESKLNRSHRDPP